MSLKFFDDVQIMIGAQQFGDATHSAAVGTGQIRADWSDIIWPIFPLVITTGAQKPNKALIHDSIWRPMGLETAGLRQ